MRHIAAWVAAQFILLRNASCEDVGCSEESVGPAAEIIIQRLNDQAKSQAVHDVLPGVSVTKFDQDHHPVVLYTQYLRIEVDGVANGRARFTHYSSDGKDILSSVARFCSSDEWPLDVESCVNALEPVAVRDASLQASQSEAIEATLSACRSWMLPPHADFGDLAADWATENPACKSSEERSQWRRSLKEELGRRALPPLRDLARLAAADLGSDGHSYDLLFVPLLEGSRLEPLRIMEIGLGASASIHTWRRYLPAAKIHTVELLLQKGCDPCSLDGVPGGVLGWGGNASDTTFLESIVNRVGMGSFDLIIDDGGHVPSGQIRSWQYLFRRALKAGGLYVILDIETSYWSSPRAELYGAPVTAGRGSNGSAIEAFKALADGVNREFFDQTWPASSRDSGSLGLDPCASRDVEMVTFAHNAVALRKTADERPHHARIYPSSGFVSEYIYPPEDGAKDPCG